MEPTNTQLTDSHGRNFVFISSSPLPKCFFLDPVSSKIGHVKRQIGLAVNEDLKRERNRKEIEKKPREELRLTKNEKKKEGEKKKEK